MLRVLTLAIAPIHRPIFLTKLITMGTLQEWITIVMHKTSMVTTKNIIRGYWRTVHIIQTTKIRMIMMIQTVMYNSQPHQQGKI